MSVEGVRQMPKPQQEREGTGAVQNSCWKAIRVDILML
jgi:hypothetical protein